VHHLADRNPVTLGDQVQRLRDHRIHSSIEAPDDRSDQT
jgi:hypothetical protein